MKQEGVRFLKGFIIGVGAILPGISGGLLAVALGLYEPIIDFIANIKTRFKNKITYFLPIILGIAAGIICFSYLTDVALTKHYDYFIAFFVGLVFSSIIDLFKEIEGSGELKFRKNILKTFMTAIILFGIFEYFKLKTKTFSPTPLNLFLCGGLLGLSFLVPGLSSSTFLVFFGAYKILAHAIYKFQFEILIPVILGSAIFVFALAKVVEKLFKTKKTALYIFIIGATAASFAAIVIDSYVRPILNEGFKNSFFYYFAIIALFTAGAKISKIFSNRYKR